MLENGGRKPKGERKKPMRRKQVLERDLVSRLRRAEGQLRGIQGMVKRDAYCIDILQQVSAVRRALDRIGLLLIRDHLETCVSDAIADRDADERIRELVNAMDRFLR